VKRFRQGEHHDVEAELRRYRPEARPVFLAALSDDLHERMRRPRTVRRAALVTAFTVAVLSLFATFGGIGYASSAANGAFHVSKIGRLVGISHSHPSRSVKVSGHSSAAQGDNPVFGDQYRPGKGCGDKNHIHARENECKKPPK
jgi:hypothetical protein